MTLRTNDKAPGCIASTVEGTINSRDGVLGSFLSVVPIGPPIPVLIPTIALQRIQSLEEDDNDVANQR